MTQHGETILNNVIVHDRISVIADFAPVRNKNGFVMGALIVLQHLPYIENMVLELDYTSLTGAAGRHSLSFSEVKRLDFRRTCFNNAY